MIFYTVIVLPQEDLNVLVIWCKYQELCISHAIWVEHLCGDWFLKMDALSSVWKNVHFELQIYETYQINDRYDRVAHIKRYDSFPSFSGFDSICRLLDIIRLLDVYHVDI